MLANAARRISSPSNVTTCAELALHSFSAAAAIVSKTGCTSFGDWLITRRISAVAVCCSKASFVSLNSRTFSIAITAWSAKVCRSAICVSENGPGSGRPTTMAPKGVCSRSRGTATTLRKDPLSAGVALTAC